MEICWCPTHQQTLQEFIFEANGGLYVDTDKTTGAGSELPSATILAKCSIIITTHKRLANEWRRGRKARTNRNDKRPLRRQKLSSKLSNEIMVYGRDSALCPAGDTYRNVKGIGRVPTSTSESNNDTLSPLLFIHFSDIVVDEGHEAGKGGVTDSLLMAEALESPRRWLLTGTPTPSTARASSASPRRTMRNRAPISRHPTRCRPFQAIVAHVYATYKIVQIICV